MQVTQKLFVVKYAIALHIHSISSPFRAMEELKCGTGISSSTDIFSVPVGSGCDKASVPGASYQHCVQHQFRTLVVAVASAPAYLVSR